MSKNAIFLTSQDNFKLPSMQGTKGLGAFLKFKQNNLAQASYACLEICNKLTLL